MKKYIKYALIHLFMELKRSKYIEKQLLGLGKTSRAQLAAVLRQSNGTVSPATAAQALSLSSTAAAKLLSAWTTQGWMQRVKRGIYVPIALESETSDAALEDSWVIAEAAFAPCYISGWSAAEHWGLTEQVFRTVVVSTVRRPRDRDPTLGGISFRLRTVNEKELFGLKTIWRSRMRVNVSDPSRTMVDLMSDPSLGGGLRSAVDMLQNYLASAEHRDIGKLIAYTQTIGVGSVFKRIGFLLARYAPEEHKAIELCAQSLTKGYTQLDPATPGTKFDANWRLAMPPSWKQP